MSGQRGGNQGGVFGAIIGPDTPRLHGPSPPAQTPEPEKLMVGKKRTPMASLRSSPTDKADQSTRTADPTARRVPSNTSATRLRTPDLPATLRPDSPGSGLRLQNNRSSSIGSSRSTGTSTPPPQLRRMDKRTSGDLRAVSLNQNPQQDLQSSSPLPTTATTSAAAAVAAASSSSSAGAAATAAVAAPATTASSTTASNPTSQQSRAPPAYNTTPVANEGRVRSKDMTDVYVS